MRVSLHPTLLRRQLDSRLKKLTTSQPVLAASLVRITKFCGRRSCRCYRGEKHVAYHLSYKVRQKTQTVYVPVDLLEEVRSWIDEHRRLKRLLQEISQLTLALVRGHAQARQRRRGRP
ncbi:MAG: hypothetical protein HY040_27310 [Planctomycetes bacterium]|nr:hypothetical protein [Planctomycetota bacterium]